MVKMKFAASYDGQVRCKSADGTILLFTGCTLGDFEDGGANGSER